MPRIGISFHVERLCAWGRSCCALPVEQRLRGEKSALVGGQFPGFKAGNGRLAHAKLCRHFSLGQPKRAANIEHRFHGTHLCAYALERQVIICASGYDFPAPPLYAAGMGTNLAEKIKAIRIAMGLNQTEFAERIGATQSTVTRWEKGSEPRGEHLQRLAELANTTVERLLNISDLTTPDDHIPVVGYVGAGAAIMPFDDYTHGDGHDFVERPPFVEGKAVAVEVRGDSLYPVAEDGWRLIYAGEQTVIEDDVLNRLCVVQLEDGRMLVKRLMRGTKPQHYHLVSTNAPLIEDARIVWAAKVKAIIPR